MRVGTATITRHVWAAALTTAVAIGVASPAIAAEDVTGMITARLDSGFTMQTIEGATVNVGMTERTKVRTNDRRGKWETSELVPGLRVKVKGTSDGSGTLVAQEVRFSRTDRRLAAAIKAGLTGTDRQVQQNAADIARQQQALTAQQRELTDQGARLDDQSGRLDDQGARIVATTGAILHTNERVANLANYNPVDSFTLYFPNNVARVPKKYLAQLAEFAARAKTINGYMVQIDGYASAIGPQAHNNGLSLRRAEAVAEVLQQQGGIPSTNLFVPAAMGITNPIGDNHTRHGQAENRRVVVTILQNQGIAQQ